MIKAIVIALASLTFSAQAFAACEVVSGGSKKAFDGGSLSGVQVEKKALTTLNKEFPGLNVIEKTFKGEVQTCTSCSDNYVTCS